jgi:myo-inositol-1(or 4)-monophosphatase
MSDDPELLELSARLTEVAADAARAVADDLRTAFRGGVDISYKRDAHDPVTVHDRAAEEKIRASITKAVPDSTIVGEEAGAAGTGGVHWYVDPIDGTANFARGLAFFCTSIGAVVDGRIVAGAVLDPIAGHLFTADLTGSRLNGQPIASRGAADETHALLITGYPNAGEIDRAGEAALRRFQRLVTAYGTVRRPGSAALSLAHVAAGWSDAAMGTSVNGWDVCAAQLLVTSAGGDYRSFTRDGSAPAWDSPCYVAHTAGLRPTVLESVVADLSGGTA